MKSIWLKLLCSLFFLGLAAGCSGAEVDKFSFSSGRDVSGENEQPIKPGESVVLEDETLSQTGLEDTDMTLKGLSSLYLTGSADQVLVGSIVNLASDDAWLFLPGVSRQEWASEELANHVQIGGQSMKDGSNCVLQNYYNGLFVKPVPSMSFSAAELWAEGSAESKPVALDKVYAGVEIPVGDNALSKIFLKRGFMMTVAENEDGTGAGKVYVATDRSQEITLGAELAGKVSFLRIVPWNYVCKRGCGGDFARKEEIGATWFYSWSTKFETTPEMDYVPMFWGNATQESVSAVVAKSRTNHVLAFNEPDGEDQSNLTVEKALERYPAILRTGLRVGSPACRESQWKNWLADFMAGCAERGYRVDFIAIHWYDWGNWGSTQNLSPEDIDAMVKRFKNNIDNCYAMYKLPIWITEFNANKNRLTDIQIRFLEKAIPMLEAHPHVERYAYFQPNGGNGDFLKGDALTDVARAYDCMPSQPSIH